MFLFSESVNPAVRSHMDSHLAFFHDLSQSLSSSFQSICEANFKLGQTLFEESLSTGQRMLTIAHPNEILPTALSSTQPASEKLRAYQRHISRLAADAQVDLTRIRQQHGPETSRTAHHLADEVTRAAAEESDLNARRNEEWMKNFRDPFKQHGQQGDHGNMGAETVRQAARDVAGANPQAESRAQSDLKEQASRSAQQAAKGNSGKPA